MRLSFSFFGSHLHLRRLRACFFLVIPALPCAEAPRAAPFLVPVAIVLTSAYHRDPTVGCFVVVVVVVAFCFGPAPRLVRSIVLFGIIGVYLKRLVRCSSMSTRTTSRPLPTDSQASASQVYTHNSMTFFT